MPKIFLILVVVLQIQFVVSNVQNEREVLSLNTDSESKAYSRKLMPIKKIPGTDLYTGIFYKVGMKVFPQGWVTWTGNNGYLEIEINPNDLPYYNPGGPSQYDNQWVFGASEYSDGFTFANRGKPLGLLTWATAEVGSGNYVAIYDDPSSVDKMSQGGEWRVDALWTPIATDERNMYKLTNKRKSDKFLNWSWAMHNKYNYYLQLAYDGQEDSKLSFKPSDIKLNALVYDFEFEHTIDDIVHNTNGNHNVDVVNVEYIVEVPNHSSETIVYALHEDVPITHEVSLSFHQSFVKLTKTSVDIDLRIPSGPIIFDFPGGFVEKQIKSASVKKLITVKETVEVPPHKNYKAGINTEWVNGVEIPFIAKMKISGLTERMVVNRVNDTVVAHIPAYALEDMLLDGHAIKVIHRSNDELIAQVSGVFKGDIAVKSYIGSVTLEHLESTKTKHS